jgi:hypothetical protein
VGSRITRGHALPRLAEALKFFPSFVPPRLFVLLALAGGIGARALKDVPNGLVLVNGTLLIDLVFSVLAPRRGRIFIPARRRASFLRRQLRNGHPHTRVASSDAASRQPASDSFFWVGSDMAKRKAVKKKAAKKIQQKKRMSPDARQRAAEEMRAAERKNRRPG